MSLSDLSVRELLSVGFQPTSAFATGFQPVVNVPESGDLRSRASAGLLS